MVLYSRDAETGMTTILALLRRIGLVVVIMMLIIWSLFPFAYALLLSFCGSVLPTKLGLPAAFSLDAYKMVLFEDPIVRYLVNSALIALFTCIVVSLISIPAGYSFSRNNSRGFSLLFCTFLVLRMLPWIALVVPLFILMGRARLLDTKASLVITYTIMQAPLAIWLMKGFFDTIPVELEEAALVDGASRLTILIKVVFPLAISGAIVMILFVWLFSYIEFLFALSFTRMKAMTFPVKIAGYQSKGKTLWRAMSGASLISMIPLIFLFVFLTKRIARGLTLGAIK